MGLEPTNKSLLTGGLQDTGVKAGLQKFVPVVWGDSVKDYMEKKLVVASMARDLSAMVANGGDLIHIPQHDEIVATDLYTSGDSGALATELSFANTTTAGSEYQLLINQSSVAALSISDLVQAQSSYDLMNLYTEKLGYALAKKIEMYLMRKLIEHVSYNYTGTTDGAGVGNYITFTGAGTYDITTKVAVPNMLTAILEADATVDDFVMLLPPQTYASLWKLDEFVKFDGVGTSYGQQVPNVGGFVGKLAGVDVMTVNTFIDIGDTNYPIDTTPTFNAANDDTSETTHLAGLIVHRDALNIAYASGMKARLQSSYSLESLSTRFVADSVYGCQIIGNNTTNKKVFALIDA